MSTPDLTEMDVRVIEFHRRRGDVAPIDYAKHLATVEDCSDEALEADVAFATPWAAKYAKGTTEATEA